MGLLLFLQLMAHHSNFGFVPWVTEDTDTPTEAQPIKNTSMKKKFLRALYDSSVNAHVELSDKIDGFSKCLTGDGEYWLQCKPHELSDLGHRSEIVVIRRQQKKIDRRLNRLGRRIARLTKQGPR